MFNLLVKAIKLALVVTYINHLVDNIPGIVIYKIDN